MASFAIMTRLFHSIKFKRCRSLLNKKGTSATPAGHWWPQKWCAHSSICSPDPCVGCVCVWCVWCVCAACGVWCVWCVCVCVVCVCGICVCGVCVVCVCGICVCGVCVCVYMCVPVQIHACVCENAPKWRWVLLLHHRYLLSR